MISIEHQIAHMLIDNRRAREGTELVIALNLLLLAKFA